MGTPSTDPFPSTEFFRSRRSIPVSSKTSGPFEPSPGYGPAVSVFISVRELLLADVVLSVLAVPFAPAPVFWVPEAPHAAKAVAPAPTPKTPSSRRRLNTVPMSNARP